MIIGLIIRLPLSFLPAFESDQNAFRFWTERLVTLGPANFYSTQVFTNNPLGILYFFWLVGIFKNIFFPNQPFASNIDPLLKLAANFSDLFVGFLIYKIIKLKTNEKLGCLATILYIFNPSLIFNSAIWGQYDGVAILFLILSVYFCLIKKSSTLCAAFFSLACVTKPQSLQLVPFLILYFVKNFKPQEWLYSTLSFVGTTLMLFFPFFPQNPFYGIYYVVSGSTNLFSCTTCNALNLWGIIMNWQNDMTLFFNLPLLYWGFILLFISLAMIFGLKRITGNTSYLTISVSMLAFFMLLTRMHERYMSYFFPFLLISAILLKSKALIGFYIYFSLIFLLNLYLPYSYYNNSVLITNLPFNNLITSNLFSFISLIAFLGFVFLFIYYLKYVKHNSNT